MKILGFEMSPEVAMFSIECILIGHNVLPRLSYGSTWWRDSLRSDLDVVGQDLEHVVQSHIDRGTWAGDRDLSPLKSIHPRTFQYVSAWVSQAMSRFDKEWNDPGRAKVMNEIAQFSKITKTLNYVFIRGAKMNPGASISSILSRCRSNVSASIKNRCDAIAKEFDADVRPWGEIWKEFDELVSDVIVSTSRMDRSIELVGGMYFQASTVCRMMSSAIKSAARRADCQPWIIWSKVGVEIGRIFWIEAAVELDRNPSITFLYEVFSEDVSLWVGEMIADAMFKIMFPMAKLVPEKEYKEFQDEMSRLHDVTDFDMFAKLSPLQIVEKFGDRLVLWIPTLNRFRQRVLEGKFEKVENLWHIPFCLE